MSKQEEVKLELKKFDLREIPDGAVCVIIGKRKTGKSFLLRDILYNKRDFPVGQVICGSEMANPFYSHFIPPIVIHGEYKKSTVERFIERQRKLREKVRGGDRKFKKIDSRAFLVMDDVSYDTSWLKDQCIREIFMNGRHFDINYYLIQHYPLGINPSLRTNIDYVFLMRENNTNNRRRIFENYAGIFPDFGTFCDALDHVTENYGCMVINNGSKSNDLEDSVYWYKAEEHEPFQMCDQSVWDYNNKNISKDHLSSFKNFNNNRKINVKKVGGTSSNHTEIQ